MANYDLEKLQEKLDKNISWRKRELTILKANVDVSLGNLLITAIRSGIALLYAHWEGFIKTAAREYLKFLNEQNIRCCDMLDNFLVLNTKTTIVDARQSNKSLAHFNVITKILYKSEEMFRVDVKDKLIVDTEKNLSYKVLEDILFSLGIEKEDFELKEHFIKDRLVNTRNGIAHGEYFNPIGVNSGNEQKAKDDYRELYNEILGLMESFKDKILDAAIEEKYLKHSSS